MKRQVPLRRHLLVGTLVVIALSATAVIAVRAARQLRAPSTVPFPALSSGIQLRSLATGFRWTFVEMPTRRTSTGRAIPEDRPITQADIIAGHRP